MFRFDEREEGYAVHRVADERLVADIRTQTVEETNDPNLRVQTKTVTTIPIERWLIHFTATRLTLPELAALHEQIIALPR